MGGVFCPLCHRTQFTGETHEPDPPAGDCRGTAPHTFLCPDPLLANKTIVLPALFSIPFF